MSLLTYKTRKLPLRICANCHRLEMYLEITIVSICFHYMLMNIYIFCTTGQKVLNDMAMVIAAAAALGKPWFIAMLSATTRYCKTRQSKTKTITSKNLFISMKVRRKCWVEKLFLLWIDVLKLKSSLARKERLNYIWLRMYTFNTYTLFTFTFMRSSSGVREFLVSNNSIFVSVVVPKLNN